MKKILKYLKNYKKECVIAPLFKMLEASFELTVPLVVAAIIDKGIYGGEGKSYIFAMIGLMVAFGVIGLSCTLVAQYFSAKAATGFAKELKSALFKHIQTLSYTEIDSLGTSSLITRMTSDSNQVQTGVNLTLRLLLRSPFVVLGAMVMAFIVSPSEAVSFVIVIPLLSIVVFGIMLISIPLYKKVQQRLDKVLLRSRENLSGARVIRAFCKEDEEIEEFEDANRQLTHSQKFVGAISALMNPLTYLIINLGIVFLVWHGALGVDSGAIKQGQLVALYSYMSQILIELIKLANLIITLTKAAASGNRIASVFEIKSSQATEENSNESVGDKSNIIEFRDVSLRYKNAGDDSLSHISFSVKAGETVGIIGATGSGKTSLVNMIPRFYDASEGAVLFCGEDIKTLDGEKVREKIGIVPQKAVLFKGSIRDNIKWGKSDASDDEILEACRAAQAIDVVNSKQDGLDAEVEQGGRNFSGGQRQRLTIARALVKSPEILILDDSSSALDFATDAALRKAIASLSYKPTVFVVSQRASSIQYADKIVVLEDGEMVGIGTHTELLENCDVYREIYDSQFKKEVV